VDATLAWTVVGSGAGVAGVAVAAVAMVAQARSGRRTSSKVTAELGHGQLDQEEGVLCVEFASGKIDVMTLPKPGKARPSADRKPRKKARHSPEFSPVNAIFIRNHGRTTVTVSRCHYESDLGGVGFRFEPQPAVSPRGDHLPKRLDPGEDAILVHDLATMRIFLNRVLRDHEVDAAVFEVVLTLGHGVEVVASPCMRVQADMSEHEMAAVGTRVVRQEIAASPAFAGRMHFERWRRRRRTRNQVE
jgi:hypothetical protein